MLFTSVSVPSSIPHFRASSSLVDQSIVHPMIDHNIRLLYFTSIIDSPYLV